MVNFLEVTTGKIGVRNSGKTSGGNPEIVTKKNFSVFKITVGSKVAALNIFFKNK